MTTNVTSNVTSGRQFGQAYTPTEIRLDRDQKTLALTFDNETKFSVPIELLRVESPSADVQGHAPSQKTLVSGKRNVGIDKIEPIGNYAVQIYFDDGHDSGYFTWNILYNFGENHKAMWSHYLENLKEAGLSRDTAPQDDTPCGSPSCSSNTSPTEIKS